MALSRALISVGLLAPLHPYRCLHPLFPFVELVPLVCPSRGLGLSASLGTSLRLQEEAENGECSDSTLVTAFLEEHGAT